MDPDACLREMRSIVLMADVVVDHEEAFDRMVDLFNGLDEWLSRGGYAPAAWRSDG